MNHLYYEDLAILQQETRGEALDPEQLRDLNNHLKECVECRQFQQAWIEARTQLVYSPVISPEHGFVDRWQERLQADRQRLHYRQTWLVLSFCCVALVLLSASLILLFWPWKASTDLVIWFWISRMYSLVALLGGIREGTWIFLQTMSGVVPFGGWILITGMVSEIAVLWLVFFRMFTNPRRIPE